MGVLLNRRFIKTLLSERWIIAHILCIVVIFNPIYSQNFDKVVSLDSLQIIWENDQFPYEKRAKALRNIIWRKWMFTNHDSTKYYTKVALELAKKNNDIDGICRANNYLAISHALQNEYDEALVLFEKSLKIFALDENINGQAFTLNNIAQCYFEKGDYIKAIKKYQEAAELYTSIGETRGIEKSYTGLIAVYKALKNEEKQFELYHKYIKLNRDSTTEISDAWFNIASYYIKQNKLDESKPYIDSILSFSRAENNTLWLGKGYGILADLATKKNRHIDTIIKYNLKALSYFKKINNYKHISQKQVALMHNYLQIGKEDKVMSIGNEVISITEKNGIHEELAEAHKILADLYYNKEMYKEGYEHFFQYSTYNDSLNRVEQDNFIDVMETNYNNNIKLSQNKYELKLAAEREKASRTIFYIVMGIILMLSLLSYFLVKKNKKIKDQKIELEEVGEFMPIGLCRVDADFNIKWANNAMKEFYNMTNTRSNYKELVHNDIYDEIRKKVGQNDPDQVTLDISMNEYFEPANDEDEEIIWVKKIIKPIKDDDNTINYLISNIDYSPEKRSKLELIKLKDLIKNNLKERLSLLSANNRLIEEVSVDIENLKRIDSHQKRKILMKLSEAANQKILNEIEKDFIYIEKEFYNKLLSRFPNLTMKNLRLCTYIKLNLSTNEIAWLNSSTPTTIKVALSRLRAKLGVNSTEEDLVSFLSNL